MRRPILAALLLVVAFAVPVHGAPKPCTDHQTCPPPAPVAMGRLITSGFETSDNTLEGGTRFGTTSFDTATVRSGTTSLKTSTIGSGIGYNFVGVLGRTYYVRTYIYVPTGGLPGSGATAVLWGKDNGGNVIGSAQLDSSGNLFLADPSNVQLGSSVALALDTWNRLELRVVLATGSIDELELRLNGATVQNSTGLTISDTFLAQVTAGGLSGATAVTQYYDDLALNDDQGASQNSWPGDGKIVLLLPTADSAKGTGWTNDAAGASNFFDAVDNKPPAGIADTTTGSGLHQIRNATSNANSSYDATMTTYSAAGIAAVDTVNVIDPIVATGAPVVTSAKQGTVGVVSNPAISNVALGAGGTSGAFWSGTGAGTYFTGWKISHGTTTYGSSVTVGTAPVMRITQVTSSTRIAMVCFMGIYVDYTPAPAVQIAYVNPMPPLLAQ